MELSSVQYYYYIVDFLDLHLYQSLWEYAGATEVANVIIACMASAISQWWLEYYFKMDLSQNLFCCIWRVLLAFAVIGRFSYRAFRTFVEKRTDKAKNVNVMVIGAGDAGNSLIREMNTSKFIQKSALCVIDDDKSKIGNYIHGVKVVGDRNDILEYAARYDIDEIIIAMPAAPRLVIKEILEICKETKCELKTLPGIYQLVNGG